jgi:replication-associated recombination protein RarA
MFARLLALPGHSFFLFGPRGTGKTTWLKQVLLDALWFELLRIQTVQTTSRSLWTPSSGSGCRHGGAAPR